jgi:GNAT superfamily N-acetyltransferase
MLIAEQPRASSRFLVEPALTKDDAALRALFRRTSMGTGIEVSFEREPSYFEASGIQGDKSEVGVIRDRLSGHIVGSGTRIMRQGFLNGELTDVGYLGDLRIDPDFRNRTLAARIYRALQDREPWCEWYYTVIFEENVRALETIAKARAGLPTYHDCGRLFCPGIELRGRLPRISSPGVSLRPGMKNDLPQIVECLNRNLSRRQFANVHHLQDFQGGTRWRGLNPEDFQIAERDNKIIGVMAAWDQSTFKQTRIVRYHGRWRWLAPLSRAVAPLRRAPGLPHAGECLSYLYACCVAVDNDDVHVFRALLRELYNAHIGKKWLYFMIGLHERDPFAPVLNEYPRVPFVGRLFAVKLSAQSTKAPALDGRIPSIEVATL